MYAIVRRYSNAAALADAMAANKDEVKKVISAVPGFVSYNSARDGDSVTSISIFNDKAGCDESTRVASQWARENVKPAPPAPEISGGEVFVNF
jgi:hypothetical protein